MLVLNLVRVRGLGLYGFQQKYEMNIGADSQCSVIEGSKLYSSYSRSHLHEFSIFLLFFMAARDLRLSSFCKYVRDCRR